MNHAIELQESRSGLVRAVCTCNGYRSQFFQRADGRAVIAGNGHLWSEEIKARRAEARELKEGKKEYTVKVVKVPSGPDWCPLHQQQAQCTCKPGCKRCNGCKCRCECYVCD